MSELEEIQTTIYTEKISVNDRTYCLDLREGINGNRYIAVSELRKNDPYPKTERLFIHEEDLTAFTNGLKRILDHLGTPFQGNATTFSRGLSYII